MADTLLAIDRHRRGRWKETGNRAGGRQTPSSFGLGQSNTALVSTRPGVLQRRQRRRGRSVGWGESRLFGSSGGTAKGQARVVDAVIEKGGGAPGRGRPRGADRAVCALLTLLPSTAPASTTRPLSPTLPCPSLLTASRMVDNSARRRSVDVGGLALALSDEGRGHGWGGWEETDSGETRFVTCSDARSPLQSPFYSTGMRST